MITLFRFGPAWGNFGCISQFVLKVETYLRMAGIEFETRSLGIDFVETEEGDRLFIADFFSLRELDAGTGDELGAIRGPIGFSELGSVMSVRSDGRNLVVTSWFDNEVKIWDPKASTVVATFPGVEQPIDALFFEGDIVVTE